MNAALGFFPDVPAQHTAPEGRHDPRFDGVNAQHRDTTRHAETLTKHLEDAAEAYWKEFGGNLGRLPGRKTAIDLGDGRGPAHLGTYFHSQKDRRAAGMKPGMLEILRSAGLGKHLQTRENGTVNFAPGTPHETNSLNMAPDYRMDSAKNRYIAIPAGDAKNLQPAISRQVG